MFFTTPEQFRRLHISPFHSSKTSLVKSDAFDKSFLGPGNSFLASEEVVHTTSGRRTSQSSLDVESSGPAVCQEDSQKSGDTSTPGVEVVKRLVHKAGFSKKVAEIIALDQRRSPACLY